MSSYLSHAQYVVHTAFLGQHEHVLDMRHVVLSPVTCHLMAQQNDQASADSVQELEQKVPWQVSGQANAQGSLTVPFAAAGLPSHDQVV